MTFRRPLALGLLALALVVALSGRAVLAAFVRSALYPAPAVAVPSPPPAPFEELALALDGSPLSAWWLPPRGEDGAVVLLLHGNGENLETLRWSGLFERFAALDAGVVALDYPGYGRSSGKPSEATLLAAARLAWQEAVALAGPRRPRAVVGWSLGAAVAAQLASAEPESIDALVLVSPWTRLHDVAALHFPAWLASSALADRYDTLAVAPELPVPALVVHGARDDLIPVEQGRRVFAALREPKRWCEVAGAGHNDLLAGDEPWAAIAAALTDVARR
jgi:pimeloyl-ACP methyl ester carboxylesterase